jgi:hypothetical protein
MSTDSDVLGAGESLNSAYMLTSQPATRQVAENDASALRRSSLVHHLVPTLVVDGKSRHRVRGNHRGSGFAEASMALYSLHLLNEGTCDH